MLKNRLNDPDFCQRHRRSPKDFTRERKLTFRHTILLLFNTIRASLQVELDNFFARLQQHDFAGRVVDKSAFSFARAKLKPEAFKELHQLAVDEFYRVTPYKTWETFRLLAFDGSTVRLPNTNAIADEFGGIYDEHNDRLIPMARLMQLYDVENEICVDLSINPYATGEGDLALAMIKNVREGDLVLVDRGFSDTALFSAICARGGHFVARVTDIYSCVDEFRNSDDEDRLVSIKLWPKANKRLASLGLSHSAQSIDVRLIKVELSTGETEILMTSLLDQDRFPRTVFRELYGKRWGIEESYKLLKCRAELDHFSGKTVHSVQQDAYATAFLAALNGIFCAVQRDAIEEAYDDRQYTYKANRSVALSKMRNSFMLFFVRSHWRLMLDAFLNDILCNVTPIRPGRTVPRTKTKRQIRAITYPPIS